METNNIPNIAVKITTDSHQGVVRLASTAFAAGRRRLLVAGRLRADVSALSQ